MFKLEINSIRNSNEDDFNKTISWNSFIISNPTTVITHRTMDRLTRFTLRADKLPFRGLSQRYTGQMKGSAALSFTEEQFPCLLTHLDNNSSSSDFFFQNTQMTERSCDEAAQKKESWATWQMFSFMEAGPPLSPMILLEGRSESSHSSRSSFMEVMLWSRLGRSHWKKIDFANIYNFLLFSYVLNLCFSTD